jgi:hypothetical protein
LLITDSTIEGSVQYEIDGDASYQTGSIYGISAGEHIIKLISPYTSPISGITYNFSQWENGSTDNPRTVTFDSNRMYDLHATYLGTPPSPPQPPATGYLAYTGWENPSLSLDSPWEDGWVSSDFILQGTNTGEYSTERAYSGSYSIKTDKHGPGVWGEWDARIQLLAGDPYRPSSGIHYYQSMWIYIDSIRGCSGAWDWGGLLSSVRSYMGQGWYTGLQFLGTPPDLNWFFRHAHTPGDSDSLWAYVVYDDSWGSYTEWQTGRTVPPSIGTVEINPHRVPLDTWFKLEWYLKRDTGSNGVYKVWITDPEQGVYDKLLFSLEGDRTWHSMSETANWQVWYQYGMHSIIYFDELYLYDYNIRG